MTKEADCGGWRVACRCAQTQLPADMATLWPGTRPSSGGSPIRCRRWRLLWPCLRAGPCDVGCAPASALKAAEASPVVVPPRVLDFWAVSGGGRSLSAPPTWGNAGAAWCFGPVRPAKPPRSCKRGSLALKMARLDVCLGLVDAGRHPRMNKASETRRRPEVSKIEINTHIKLTSVSRRYKETAG